MFCAMFSCNAVVDVNDNHNRFGGKSFVTIASGRVEVLRDDKSHKAQVCKKLLIVNDNRNRSVEPRMNDSRSRSGATL
jgi:hypothetical protein